MANKIFSCLDLTSLNNQMTIAISFADYLAKKNHKVLLVDLELFSGFSNYEKLSKKSIITRNVTNPFCIYNFEKNFKIFLLINPLVNEKMANFSLDKIINILSDEIIKWSKLFDYVIISNSKKFLQLNNAISSIVDELILSADINEISLTTFTKNIYENIQSELFCKNKNICLYNFDTNQIENISTLMQLNKLFINKKNITKLQSFPKCNNISQIKKINQWSDFYIFIESINILK